MIRTGLMPVLVVLVRQHFIAGSGTLVMVVTLGLVAAVVAALAHQLTIRGLVMAVRVAMG